MEDTLRADLDSNLSPIVYGLNPCFNGRYSHSIKNRWLK